MKIVIAPDSFKESLSAMAVADAIEAGFKLVLPDATYVKLPMADGGEGTVQSLVDAMDAAKSAGIAAIAVCRPLPYIRLQPPKIGEVAGELLSKGEPSTQSTKPGNPN